MKGILTSKNFYIGIIIPLVAAVIALIPWWFDNSKLAAVTVEVAHLRGSSSLEGHSFSNGWSLFEEGSDGKVVCNSSYKPFLPMDSPAILPDEHLPEITLTLRNTGEQSATIYGLRISTAGLQEQSSTIRVSEIMADSSLEILAGKDVDAVFEPRVNLEAGKVVTIRTRLEPTGSFDHTENLVCMDIWLTFFDGDEIIRKNIGAFALFRGVFL